MATIRDLDNMVQRAVAKGIRKKVAVVWAADSTTRHAIASALNEGFAEAIFVGCRQQVEADMDVMAHSQYVTIIDADDPDAAAATAVQLIRNGQAEVLMKGMINTDNMLRAVLDKENGILPVGSVLTHVAVAHIPTYHKLLLFSDAAVIPYPSDDQRHAQVRYMVDILHRMGVAIPKIALIHCSEKVDVRHFPFTADYEWLAEKAKSGELGKCIVDGPMDVKVACSLQAMKKKNMDSPIKGAADALVFADIEAANAFYKTITLFCEAQIAGVLVGTKAPIVLPSRGDSVRSKFYSLALACIKV